MTVNKNKTALSYYLGSRMKWNAHSNLVDVMDGVFPSKEPFSNNEYLILGETWVDVDFLAVSKLTKTTFPMAYEAKKGGLTFSFYVIKRFTQILVKVNQKMKNKRVLESYYNLFYYQLSSSARLTLLRSHPSSMKGVLNFVITDPIDSQFC